MRPIIMPAKIAAQKFVTCNGVYKILARYTVKPFTTTMNNPNVSTMAGRDNITMSGLINVLIIARINPAISIVHKRSP